MEEIRVKWSESTSLFTFLFLVYIHAILLILFTICHINRHYKDLSSSAVALVSSRGAQPESETLLGLVSPLEVSVIFSPKIHDAVKNGFPLCTITDWHVSTSLEQFSFQKEY